MHQKDWKKKKKMLPTADKILEEYANLINGYITMVVPIVHVASRAKTIGDLLHLFLQHLQHTQPLSHCLMKLLLFFG